MAPYQTEIEYCLNCIMSADCSDSRCVYKIRKARMNRQWLSDVERKQKQNERKRRSRERLGRN